MQSNLCRMSRLVPIVFLVLFATGASADETDEIVTGCHFSNAEWGAEMIDICVKENQATRAEVLRYPEKYRRFVERCRRGSENGWSWVKTCIDKDIAAESALAEYPKEHAGLIKFCDAQFGHRGAAAIRSCVNRALEGPKNN